MLPSRLITIGNLTCCRLNKIPLYRLISSSNIGLCNNAKTVEETPAENVTPENTEVLLQEISKLSEEKTNLLAQVADFEGKYKRTLADRENVRNRLEKQIIEAKQYGIQGFCKDLLEVTDIFQKAIETVPADDLEKDSSLKSLYDGLVMTETTLHTVFRRHKLMKLEINVGDKFNPAEQEAMFEVPASNSQSPGSIAHVMRPGWKLHDRCIRSAQVGVIKE